jgi:gas vesicle protein
MSSNSTSFLMLVAGIAAGAALGILFAPKSGKDTRADLMHKGEDLVKRLKDLVSEAEEKVTEKAGQVKDKVNDLKGEATRQASQARA